MLCSLPCYVLYTHVLAFLPYDCRVNAHLALPPAHRLRTRLKQCDLEYLDVRFAIVKALKYFKNSPSPMPGERAIELFRFLRTVPVLFRCKIKFREIAINKIKELSSARQEGSLLKTAMDHPMRVIQSPGFAFDHEVDETFRDDFHAV